MATVCDYCLFQDYQFTLQQSGPETLKSLRKTLNGSPVGGEGVVLTWKVRRGGTGKVNYQVSVNGSTPEGTYVLSNDDTHSIQEVVPTDRLVSGENEVTFAVTGGTGNLTIGDVVMFFRQNT